MGGGSRSVLGGSPKNSVFGAKPSKNGAWGETFEKSKKKFVTASRIEKKYLGDFFLVQILKRQFGDM